MAELTLDALVLSESEANVLLSNLLCPQENSERVQFLDSLEALSLSMHETGFSVTMPAIELTDETTTTIVINPQVKAAHAYTFFCTSMSVQYAHKSDHPYAAPFTPATAPRKYAAYKGVPEHRGSFAFSKAA